MEMKRKTEWDAEVKGLHTISFPSGRSSWYLYYRVNTGKQRRQKLAGTGIISLGEARDRARKLLAEVTLGRDPFDRSGRTECVAGLFNILISTHWTVEKAWSKEAARLYGKYLQASFGPLIASSVTAPQVYRWHRKFKDNIYEGNRAKSVLSKIMGFAESMGERPVGSNPCRAVPNFPEKKRKRFATDIEIAKIGEILRREEVDCPREVAFIYLLIFTGSRPSAIERSTWSELKRCSIDGEEYGLLQITGKTGPEEVVLPPQAMSVLSRLGRTEGTLTGIKFPVTFWNKIRVEAGCPDLWARDWRRTFGTLGLSNGMPLGMLSELLNHKDQKTTMLYAKLIADSRLRASYAIGKQLEQRLG